MKQKDLVVLPLNEISPEARRLAEALHHEARTERIFSICEYALREAKSEGQSADNQSTSNP